MLKAFSGRGLVPDGMAAEPRFLLAVAGGAGGAGLLATRLGFPVSTTHLLVGALMGSGWVAGSVNGGMVWESFLRPLLVSPVLAVVAGVIVHAVVRRVSREREGRSRGLDAGHWLSAGAVCFARGLNDTPKMAALPTTGVAGDMSVIGEARMSTLTPALSRPLLLLTTM